MVTANVPPALCCGGIFITDVYKYTEKTERKKLNEKKKLKHQTIPKNHQAPPLHKTAVTSS
ncbi:hypothetical protein FCR2A7T_06910 [Flavobacterium cauense R2A-7]|nr:hypothetical protein FCR2A7T_06910 [Flavobacterium cauense R2A-7]KGO79016.1 hypothetical protein Q762_14705 [Flavobacterium cauense R2A-7]